MKKVLIVDDEESMRLLLRRILEAIPALEVSFAEGPARALAAVAQHKYDVILLDLLMPQTGGIEVLARLRAASINPNTPVIIVSAVSDPDTRRVCQSLGVTDYVVKPIERQALLTAVRKQLGAAPNR